MRDLILVKPKTVTPMGKMVLAIRLYDVGLRDDAVFCFTPNCRAMAKSICGPDRGF